MPAAATSKTSKKINQYFIPNEINVNPFFISGRKYT